MTLTNGKTLVKEMLTMQGEREKPIAAEDHAAKIKALINSSPNEDVRDYANKLIEQFSAK